MTTINRIPPPNWCHPRPITDVVDKLSELLDDMVGARIKIVMVKRGSNDRIPISDGMLVDLNIISSLVTKLRSEVSFTETPTPDYITYVEDLITQYTNDWNALKTQMYR